MAMNMYNIGVAVVLVGMFVAGVTQYINSANTIQDLGLNESQFDTLVKIGETSTNATQAGQTLFSGGIEEADTLTTFSSKGFESAKQLGTIPSIAKSLVNDGFSLLGFLGISPLFMTGSLVLLTLALVVALIAVIMKVRP